MSTTIRVSREDKQRLARLAKRLSLDTMTEALRKAIEIAEESDEKFKGDLGALTRTLRHAVSHGKNVSERADQELAKAIQDE